MSDKFNDILSEIKNNRSVLKVMAPSKQVEVELSPLTLAQQKLIIETTSDNTLGVLFFNNVFFKILKENIKGNINDYNTIDRVNLTLALRQHLRDNISNDDSEVMVTDILTRNNTLPYNIEPAVITSGDFTFTVEIPSLDVDNFINTHLLNKYKNATFDENKLKNLISDLYACEILKFIKNIKINDKEITLHNELTSSIKVLESIDSIHFIQITQYINSIRDEEAKYTKYVNSEKSIDIIPDLFIL
jgi:hypothetical protein|tara:strand:- start:33 stop:770 length:738 start_codon:yes stop_codon:yes gene_type:complete